MSGRINLSAEVMPTPRFKVPHLGSYRGRTNPVDHVSTFELMNSLLDIKDVLKCHLFFTMLKESTLRRFIQLLVGVNTEDQVYEIDQISILQVTNKWSADLNEGILA
ncbi:hypothetical protein IEQ34_018946 [Dendrobium chrysotoxum]|uniref:Uncharacterized protein n=1 Tax=Dendrobium chrysotoxum TaxID=161865 RepID=A0AAV7G5Z1_DENCH|nr:hypothetical protein IEQ34_018946 [Dendrobium chrysotoxum]